MLISLAEPGEPIDISSLTRGTYILNVIADGTYIAEHLLNDESTLRINYVSYEE